MWLWNFYDEKLEKWELLTRNDLMGDPDCDWNDAVIFSITEDWGLSPVRSSITVYKYSKSENRYYIEIIDDFRLKGCKQQFDIGYEAENIIWIIKDNMKILKWIWKFEEEGVADGTYTEIYFSDLVEWVYFSYWMWVNKNCKNFKQAMKVNNKIKRIIKTVSREYDYKPSKDLLKY